MFYIIMLYIITVEAIFYEKNAISVYFNKIVKILSPSTILECVIILTYPSHGKYIREYSEFRPPPTEGLHFQKEILLYNLTQTYL